MEAFVFSGVFSTSDIGSMFSVRNLFIVVGLAFESLSAERRATRNEDTGHSNNAIFLSHRSCFQILID